MAAPTVGVDNERVSAMDANVNISGFGGGAGADVEEDFTYQNNLSISRKLTGGLKGFAHDGGTAQNMTVSARSTVLFKANITNYGAITTFSLRVGSSSSAYYEFLIADDSGTLDYPFAGGWMLVPINPSLTYHTASSGSPALASADYFGLAAQLSAAAKSQNAVLDAVDLYFGCYIYDGDVTTPGTFQDLIDNDEGTVANRYGGISTKEGIIFALGTVAIGRSYSVGVKTSQVVYFEDEGRTVVFPDGRFDDGYASLILDVSNSSTEYINISGCSFLGRGSTKTESDTRPVADFIGPANADGTGNIDGCLFDNFASMQIDYKFSGAATFKNCGTITNKANLGGDSDNLDGSSFTGSPIAATESQLLADDDGSTVDLSDMSFVSGGTGHAIKFPSSFLSTVTINLNNVTFEGYAGSDGSTGNETLYITKTSGTYTVNVFGGTVPTIKTEGATVNVVVNPVDLDITVISATTGAVIPSARVRILADTGGDLTAGDVIIEGLTDGTGKISDTRAYTADQPITGRVRKSSVSPYYKTGNVVGTVVSDAGLAITVSLIDDE